MLIIHSQKMLRNSTRFILAVWWGALFPSISTEGNSAEASWKWGEEITPAHKTVQKYQEKGSQLGLSKLPAESFDELQPSEHRDVQPKAKAQRQPAQDKAAKK
jgi:hypothetical protein